MSLSPSSSTGVQTAKPSLTSIAQITSEVRRDAAEKTRRIAQITGQMKILALNAMIESTRAGEFGRGFSVVAQEVRSVGSEVETVAKELDGHLSRRIQVLQEQIEAMTAQAQGERLMDLSLNAIELIDRNLYERTCDVRWWATDSAVVDCAAAPTADRVAYTCDRLGVILSAYTVYLDLWLCDLSGKVVANGRPDRYSVIGADVSSESWFGRAAALASGDDYVAADIAYQNRLDHAQVATFCASVREGGRANGKPLGVLAIHFDWEPQARAIVEGVRIAPEDRARTRVLLVDARNRVIAASDGRGILSEIVPLRQASGRSGFYVDESGTLVAYHGTPGYETYRGMGWSGAILQTSP